MPCPSPTFSGEQFQNWRFRNWLGNVSVVSERHFVPDSLQSLVRVVTDAAQEGRSVRAIGRGWWCNGWSRHCAPRGALGSPNVDLWQANSRNACHNSTLAANYTVASRCP